MDLESKHISKPDTGNVPIALYHLLKDRASEKM